MKSKLLAFAVPVIIGLLAFSNAVQACVGGDPGITYMDESMTAQESGYVVESFIVKEPRDAEVLMKGNGRLYVLDEEQMQDYKAGSNFSYVATMENGTDYTNSWVDLKAGRYFAVLEAPEGWGQAQADVDIGVPAEKCGADIDTPLPTPGFEPGLLIISLAIVGGLIAFTGGGRR